MKKQKQKQKQKKTGFNRYVYDFSVDYDIIDNSDITNIHICLMKKNNIK